MSDPEKILEVLKMIVAIIMFAIFAIGGIILIQKMKKKYAGKKSQNIPNWGRNAKTQNSLNKPCCNINSIFDFMEFKKIEDNMILQQNGKYLMIIECQGVNYDLMSDEERTSVEEGFLQFLNTLKSEIQIYVQTRTVNLENSLNTYREKFREIEKKYNELTEKYNRYKRTEGYSDKEIQEAYLDMVRQKNKYEYTKDIIRDTETNNLNSSVLHKKYYIVIPAYEDEIVTDNCSQDEIQNMIFSELYTKARSMIRTLSRCEISSRILDSEELVDLLYVAYNRDESDLFDAKRALGSGFEDIYSTAPDVFEKKLKILNRQIEEAGSKLAYNVVEEAKSDKEMLLRIRKQQEQNLIYEFAKDLIDDNKKYLGDEIAEDAKAKIKIMKQEAKEKGGKKDANEKKTTRRRKTTGE